MPGAPGGGYGRSSPASSPAWSAAPRSDPVRSCGLFHSAHRARLSALDSGVAPPLPPQAAFHASRRVWSRASVAQATTWNGMERIRAADRARAALVDHVGDPLRAVAPTRG